MSEAYRIIGGTVYDPTVGSIFHKAKKSERAEYRTILCKCDSCPLLAVGACIEVGMFSHCVYGKFSKETGPTRQAKTFSEWVNARKEQSKSFGWPKQAPAKLSFIGDYVYLPYPHMDMCKDVPFVRHSAFIVSGVQFIPCAAWTLKNVLTLIDFRPQALMGGEIGSYQREVIPLFKEHIRECDSEMWSQVILGRPQYDVAPNYVGRKAVVKTLAFPITIPAYDARYPVEWQWNGSTLTTTDIHAYGSTWGHVDAKSVKVELAPSDSATVVVKDNNWVVSSTVFVD